MASSDGAPHEASDVALSSSPAAARSQATGVSSRDALKERIDKESATVGIVGLGYAGLPLAVEYAKNGFSTIGFDFDEERISQLDAGENYIDDVADEDVAQVVENERLEATSTFERAGKVDVFFVCVPTPVTPHKDPDTSYIEAAARSIAEHVRSGQLVIVKSTTYPDTTEGLVQPILEEAASKEDLQIGRDYFLAFSPERIDPGNEQFTTANTPVVVGGVSKACTELASRATEQIVGEVHPVSSPKVGEMEKLLENIFRSVNIALVNEMAQLCDRMGGISVWEVVEAAASKPFGFMPFYPGPGLGGHCIPIDPYYLSWLARRHDFETSFITLSARVNEEMPHYVADAVVRAVAEQPVRLAEASVLLLGVAFKKDVGDTRNSPAYKVVELLRKEGVGAVQYSDPHVPAFGNGTPHAGNADVPGMESTPLSEEALREHHVSVVLTDHSAFPYSDIAEHAPAVVDARNALSHVPHDRDKINVLGGGDF